MKKRLRAKRKRSREGGLRKGCPCAPASWRLCPHNWLLLATPSKGAKQIRVSLRTPDLAEAERKRDGYLRAYGGAQRPAGQLTFEALADLYVAERGPDYHASAVKRMLGPKAVDAVDVDDVEALRAAWLRDRKPGCKGGRTGANRMLARVRHIFNWAIRKRLATGTPFKAHGVSMVSLDTKAESARTRRLEGDEEARLLAGAGDPLMRDLIVAMLETGCRVGELLSLQWPQVKRDAAGVPRRVELLASKTKTRVGRTVPATARLREVLERRQRGPDGELLGPGCYVFGTDTGDRRKVVRRAWEAACEAAKIPRDDAGRFTLHKHDLRREFASRLLESGASLAEVQAALGHKNITMTSRYLGTTDAGLQSAFERLERHQAAR